MARFSWHGLPRPEVFVLTAVVFMNDFRVGGVLLGITNCNNMGDDSLTTIYVQALLEIIKLLIRRHKGRPKRCSCFREYRKA